MDFGCSVTAVGDDKQRIMVWAGAYNDVFDDYERDFKCTRKHLVMNFRSAPKLIIIQKLIAQYMGKDEVEILPSPKWQKEDGECEVYRFKDPMSEAKDIARKVATLLELENLKPHDLCFIVRQKPVNYADLLIRELQTIGIEARNETDYQDLLSEEINLLLIHLISHFNWEEGC